MEASDERCLGLLLGAAHLKGKCEDKRTMHYFLCLWSIAVISMQKTFNFSVWSCLFEIVRTQILHYRTGIVYRCSKIFLEWTDCHRRYFLLLLVSPSDSWSSTSQLRSLPHHHPCPIVLNPQTLSLLFFFHLDAWFLPFFLPAPLAIFSLFAVTSIAPITIPPWRKLRSASTHWEASGKMGTTTEFDCGLVCMISKPPINSRKQL